MILCVISFFCGCSKPQITLLTDPVWSIKFQEAPKDSIEIREIGIDADILNAIKSELSLIKSDTVVVSPLLSALWIQGGGEELPEKVTLLYPPSAEKNALNQGIRITREQAFRKSGDFLGRLVTDKESTFFGTAVGAVFYIGTEERIREMEAFREGFLGTSPSENLALYQIESAENQAAVNSPIQDIKTRNIRLVLLSASRLNTYCIERLDRAENRVIVEEGFEIEKFGKLIFGSIDFDPMDFIDFLEGRLSEGVLSGEYKAQLKIFDDAYSF